MRVPAVVSPVRDPGAQPICGAPDMNYCASPMWGQYLEPVRTGEVEMSYASASGRTVLLQRSIAVMAALASFIPIVLRAQAPDSIALCRTQTQSIQAPYGRVNAQVWVCNTKAAAYTAEKIDSKFKAVADAEARMVVAMHAIVDSGKVDVMQSIDSTIARQLMPAVLDELEALLLQKLKSDSVFRRAVAVAIAGDLAALRVTR